LARSDDGDETHYSALEVANDTLGALRKSLEDTGRWDSTVIIVSSDHAERAKNSGDFSFLPEEQRKEAVNDTRIPFIVKFANQETPVAYEPILNTVISKQLIIEIFENRIKTATDMVAWLDQLQIERPDLINRPSTGRKH
jgi:arylsulfatase A-like enzyme